VDSLKRNIDLSVLPATFKDVIIVARKLNIPFLWINSLCIIQDSTPDWQVEAARIGNYYYNALLTISATLSESASEPFLCRRLPQFNEVPFHFQDVSGTQTVVLARLLQTRQRYLETPAYGHLLSRGWTFQEAALSRRTVHYTANEIIWVSLNGGVVEDGSVIDEVSDICCGDFLRNSAIGGWNSDQLFRTWNSVVEQYSERKLTFPGDKLPAVSGLAAKFQQSAEAHDLGSRHLAGLWGNDLINGLCWCLNKRSSWFKPVPREYRAPSWSWASIDGAVTFESDLAYEYDCQPKAEVVEVQCSVPGKNPFGAVSEGFLTLRGPLMPVRVYAFDPVDPWSYGVRLASETVDMLRVRDEIDAYKEYSITWASFSPDTMLCESAGFGKTRILTRTSVPDGSILESSAHCLVIAVDDNGEFLCLLIARTPGPVEFYTRIGLVKCRQQSWADSATAKVVTIR
jgi:hypothetical protein